MSTKIYSFSHKPNDKKSEQAIDKLKEHSRRTGISFSHLVLKAIKRYVEELDNESRKG